MATADRLETIETKLAFQEDTVQALNDALVAQQSRMDALERRLQAVLDELQLLRAGAEPSVEEPPPPHY